MDVPCSIQGNIHAFSLIINVSRILGTYQFRSLLFGPLVHLTISFVTSIISLMKKTAINLTDGPILRSIIAFAIPIIISNIFQQLYNTADIMIVGRFLGQDALAAVGATAAIFELIVGFSLGVGTGWALLSHAITGPITIAS